MSPTESRPFDIEGVDAPNVSSWLTTNIAGARAPFTFSLIAGGHSNLTFAVDCADGRRLVLRRPPLGHVLATAHDMGREHKIIAALGPTSVPVAPALGLCTDVEVNGAPFYIMEFVPGEVIHDAAKAEESLDEAGRRRLGEQLIDVLADLHAIDPDDVGLGDLGRKEGFIERQLKRWYGQWEKSKTRELAEIDDVYHHLVSRIPDQGKAGIVHGDYRAGNCITAPDGTLRAVLDWELCTLGDVLADVGYFAMSWTSASEEQRQAAPSPSTVPGFPDRSELLRRYEERSGRSLAQIDFYVAFSLWKLACIVEGVYARYLHGAMGSGKTGFEAFKLQVERCAEQAAEISARIS